MDCVCDKPTHDVRSVNNPDDVIIADVVRFSCFCHRTLHEVRMHGKKEYFAGCRPIFSS